MLDNYSYFILNSIKIYNVDINILIKLVDYYYLNKIKFIGHYIHAHLIELSYTNEELKKALKESSINFSEGTGVWLASKYLSEGNSSRINFTDSSFPFIEHCINKAYKIFLLGSTDRVLDKAVKNIQKRYSNIKIVGYYNGYDENDDFIINYINEREPNILLVGMSSPKQELWIHKNKEKIFSNVFISVGDLFTHWAGEKVRGPKVFRNLGFEWLFRAISNPKLYFKRYFIGIPKFLFHLLMEKRAQNK